MSSGWKDHRIVSEMQCYYVSTNFQGESLYAHIFAKTYKDTSRHLTPALQGTFAPIKGSFWGIQ